MATCGEQAGQQVLAKIARNIQLTLAQKFSDEEGTPVLMKHLAPHYLQIFILECFSIEFEFKAHWQAACLGLFKVLYDLLYVQALITLVFQSSDWQLSADKVELSEAFCIPNLLLLEKKARSDPELNEKWIEVQLPSLRKLYLVSKMMELASAAGDAEAMAKFKESQFEILKFRSNLEEFDFLMEKLELDRAVSLEKLILLDSELSQPEQLRSDVAAILHQLRSPKYL